MTIVYLDRQKIVGISVLAAIVTFVAGILIGYFGIRSNPETLSRRYQSELNALIKESIEEIDANNIRSYLQIIAKTPHIAASERDRELTNWIAQEWRTSGIDRVQLDSYNILLSYPDPNNPNKIYLKDGNDNIKFTSKHKEDVLRPEDEHPNFIHAFNGFAPSGNVAGELVYVNYGRIEDVQRLKELNVDLTGKIAISRYGRIFRGNKVKNCQDAGAIGVIMFSDPADVAPYGTDPKDVYPNTMFLPPSGIQRGAVLLTSGSEVLSPGWPSVDGAYRLTINETADRFPKIPSQPIGYGDAKELLAVMGGDNVPDEWKGKIPGITYSLGPGFDQDHQGWKVNLVVNNFLKDTKSDNIIGVIQGSEEPDRYVIIGNHRDAWGYGAIDPGSGTAALMEIAKTLGEKLKAGWRPRRTIILASWTAEESGLFGSSEWVTEKVHKLRSRAVSYLNMDICVSGDFLAGFASPLLKEVFKNAMRSTDKDGQSYYDYLQAYYQSESPPKDLADTIGALGSGSDQDSFAFFAGVPSTFHFFKIDKRKVPNITGYPAYHTGIETFYLMDKIVDPGFKTLRSCAQITLHMALQLAETSIIPYSLDEIPREVDKALNGFEETFKTLRQNGLGDSIDVLIKSWNTFKKTINDFIERTEGVDKNLDSLRLRMLNDKIMLLERVFLLPEGLPGRPNYKNALFSPSKFNSYAGTVFPGIKDLMHDFGDLTTAEKPERIKMLKRHLSDLMIAFRQATFWLSDDLI